ncbi:D-alanyl-D-alanine carboxypeptidase family protein [Clostridium sp.]|uniref:D-alanyl-D-alanine carboxypeptidase family protein n=1 Tax=Clostridium sp. TaxID=1506 RepID=UPI0034647F79
MLNNKSYQKRKNAFYKKQDIFYKKKSGFNKGTTIIIGLLFLVGIMIGLVLKEDSKVLDVANKLNNDYESGTSNYNEGKITPSRGNSVDKYGNLEEVPDLNDSMVSSTLTKEEINEVKKIINSDTTGLYTLVNRENLLSEDYMPDNLVIPNINLVSERSNEKNLVSAAMVKDLEQMFYDAQAEGMNLFLSNGFRGYESQVYIYNEEIQNKDNKHSEYVAKPGESEHQLGLAIDITSSDMSFELNQSFENTKEGAWALENAYKYGFILRYTKTKEDITGYKYEPWHYRYVGNKTISKLCHDKGLTLEELLDYAKSE